MILTKTAAKKEAKRKTRKEGITKTRKEETVTHSTRLMDSEKRKGVIDIGETVVTPFFESKNHIGCKVEATVLEDLPDGYVLSLCNGTSVVRTADDIYRVSAVRLIEGCPVEMLEFDKRAGNVRGYWEATFLNMCDVPGEGSHVVVQWKNTYENVEEFAVRPRNTAFICTPIRQTSEVQIIPHNVEKEIGMKQEGWFTLSPIEKKRLVTRVFTDMVKFDGWSFDDAMLCKFTQWNEFQHVRYYKEETEAYLRDYTVVSQWCLLKSFSAGFNKAYARQCIPLFSVVSTGHGNGEDLLSVTQLITDSKVHWIYASPFVDGHHEIIVGASNVT